MRNLGVAILALTALFTGWCSIGFYTNGRGNFSIYTVDFIILIVSLIMPVLLGRIAWRIYKRPANSKLTFAELMMGVVLLPSVIFLWFFYLLLIDEWPFLIWFVVLVAPVLLGWWARRINKRPTGSHLAGTELFMDGLSLLMLVLILSFIVPHFAALNRFPEWPSVLMLVVLVLLGWGAWRNHKRPTDSPPADPDQHPDDKREDQNGIGSRIKSYNGREILKAESGVSVDGEQFSNVVEAEKWIDENSTT
jgi:hypothetical protein